MRRIVPGLLLALGVVACAAEDANTEQGDDDIVSGDAAVSCKETDDTAFVSGSPTKIKVIHISGKAISKTTGHAFLIMQTAAKKAGVNMMLSSGFRTMGEQEHLYDCYRTKSCNNGNLAAKPGYSNHQNGAAVDVSTSTWLAANGTKYGFARTVPSEAWHWEYHGKDPGGPCTKEGEPTSKPGDAGASTAKDASAPSKDASTPTKPQKDAGAPKVDASTSDEDAGAEPATGVEDQETAASDEHETDPSQRDDKDGKDSSEEESSSKARHPAPAASGCAIGSPGAPRLGIAVLLAGALLLAERRRRVRR